MSRRYQAPQFLTSPSFESLLEFVQESHPESFADFERELRERVSAFESELLAEKLESYDVDTPMVRIDGVGYRRKHRSKGRYCGISGEFEIERTMYVPRGGGRSVCPLELRAGIVEGYFTPRAGLVSAQAVALGTPKEAHELFVELGGMRPSTSSLDRLPKHLSEKWEQKREEFESELREQEVVPAESCAVAISIDGVHVPMKESGRAEKRRAEGRRPQGPAGFREVGCGTVTLLDGEGARQATVRYGRKPEKNKSVVKAQVEAELASILAVRPDLTVVALADGARENWEFFRGVGERLGIEVIEAVDFYHVCERLKAAFDACYGEQSAESKSRFERFRVLLEEKSDGVERVIRALNARRDKLTGWRRKTVEAQLRYFRRYRHKMPYKELRDRDLPIGSGVVEAACKTLASSRLKRSGMAWGLEGVQAILTLRSLMQSGRWVAGWNLLATEYTAEIQPLESAA